MVTGVGRHHVLSEKDLNFSVRPITAEFAVLKDNTLLSSINGIQSPNSNAA
jgi:hypothetical protein